MCSEDNVYTSWIVGEEREGREGKERVLQHEFGNVCHQLKEVATGSRRKLAIIAE